MEVRHRSECQEVADLLRLPQIQLAGALRGVFSHQRPEEPAVDLEVKEQPEPTKGLLSRGWSFPNQHSSGSVGGAKDRKEATALL